MILYFVRHGETEWNVKKKIQGATDIPLNENGRRQARDLAEQLVRQRDRGTLHVVRAYTSPKLRAAETAQVAAEALGIPCIPLDGLKEMSMGIWEGLTWETVQRDFSEDYHRWNADRRYAKTPQGESYNELLIRTFDALSYILEREQQDVLVVSHSAVLMAIRCYVAGCSFDEDTTVGSSKTSNTEVVELSEQEIRQAIERFSRKE